MPKHVTKISEPTIVNLPERPYLGIRIQTPFDGMFKQVTLIKRELNQWFKAQRIAPGTPPFLRYHVIDMRGEMDVAYGVILESPLPADERVTAGVLPAGRYARLVYSGSGLQGHKALLDWIRDQQLPVERWESEKGDVFGCRYEAYLTDPKVEPLKTRWDIELAIKLADE